MSAIKLFHGVRLFAILAAGMVASDELVHDPDTSACLDKINEYLWTFGLTYEKLEGSQQQKIETGKLLTDQMIMALDQAKHHLEVPLEAGESLGSIFRPLKTSRGCSQRRLSAVVANIRDAFDSCSQVSLDYLMILANYKLINGDQVLINKLARNRIELCWQRFVSGVSRQIDDVMGKMTKPVFKNIEQIAEIMIGTKEADSKRAYAMDSIHIDEQKARNRAKAEAELELMGEDLTILDMMEKRPETFSAILETIKRIDFKQDERIREFSRAIYKLFMQQKAVKSMDRRERNRLLRGFLSDFLDGPCQELVNRVRSIVALGEIYRRHMEQTLGQALAEEKKSNPRLDYELEVYRICKFEKAETGKIIEFMERAS